MSFSRGISIFLLLLAALPARASAHPLVDRAVEAYEEADFETALRSFDEAASNADLSVEELLRLFEMRSLVHHALEDDEAMRQDLRRLVAVRPSYRLGRLAPPPVRVAFEEVLEQSRDARVELRIEEENLGGERTMLARVLNAPEGLVDHVALECSVGPERKTVTRTAKGTRTELRLPSHGLHNGCHASARTRQGGVLFRASVEGPVETASQIFTTPQYPEQADRSAGGNKKKWPWIVAAAAVVVVGGVTAGVVLSTQSTGNQAELGDLKVSW